MPTTATRHRDAVLIQQGACNPSGIARALVRAIDECEAEGAYAREDYAVQAILHQLSFICGVDLFDREYRSRMAALEERALEAGVQA